MHPSRARSRVAPTFLRTPAQCRFFLVGAFPDPPHSFFAPRTTNNDRPSPLSPCLVSPQGIIDRNKVLIHEINRNHDARYIHPEGLHRNVDLIRELNANMLKAQELYEAAGGEFYQHAAVSRARKPRARSEVWMTRVRAQNLTSA